MGQMGESSVECAGVLGSVWIGMLRVCSFEHVNFLVRIFISTQESRMSTEDGQTHLAIELLRCFITNSLEKIG